VINRAQSKMGGSGDGGGSGTGGAGEASGSGGMLWMIIWGVLLIFAAIWVAGFCAWWYIMLLPFIVCIPQAAFITDVLLRGTQITYFCAWNMMNQNTFNEAWAAAPGCIPPVAIVAQPSTTQTA